MTGRVQRLFVSDVEQKPVHIALLKEVVARGINLRVRVCGESMYPFIRPGATIIIKATQLQDLVKGDLVLYYVQNRLVTHRVLGKKKSNAQITLLIKGDAVAYFDHPVQEHQIIGKVAALEKNGRVTRLDTLAQKVSNYIISRYSLLNPWLLPPLRLFKNALRISLRKM